MDRAPNGGDGIEDRAIAVPKRRRAIHRRGSGRGAAAAQKPRAIRLEGDLTDFRTLNEHEMKHPGRLLAAGAWTPRAEESALRAEDFCLNEKFAERRMRVVGGRRVQSHFGVAGHFDGARFAGMIGQRDAAHFYIIFR